VEHLSSHSGQSRAHARIRRAVGILTLLILSIVLPTLVIQPLPPIRALGNSEYAQIAPNGLTNPQSWGIFANTEDNKDAPCQANEVSCGDIQIDVNKTGIAVRIEIPREFLETVEAENDTYFVESNIRSDRYYYSLIDESKHWTYGWRGQPSDGPCYKPNFPMFDPNAPWCLEIWNYLNGSFLNFTAPKFVRLHGLHAPTIAGKYNFTLFVAANKNSLGYPDFVNANAWNTTLFVPVTLAPDPATINGSICYEPLNRTGCFPIIGAKGVAYAINSSTMKKVARAYINQTSGNFTLTGLAPTPTSHAWGYYVTASAGVARFSSQNVSFSESNALCRSDPYSHSPCGGALSYLTSGEDLSIGEIRLRPSPVVTGTIRYVDAMNGTKTCPLGNPQYVEDPVLPWFTRVGVNVLNITVEAYDNLQPSHIYRYQTEPNPGGCGDTFRIITGTGESYVGLDPYGTEFAGLPPPDLGYKIVVRVWVTGYVQSTFLPPSNSQNEINVGDIAMKSGALITGLVEFADTLDITNPHFQSPRYAELNATGTATDALFGGNLIIEARYKDSTGQFRLGGVAVINGTAISGNTTYALRQNITYAIIGFSEYYNRTSNGRWSCKWSTFPGTLVTDYCRDQGFGDLEISGSSLETEIAVYVRGYDQLDTSSISVYQGIQKEKNLVMVQGGVLRVGVYSYINRPGSRALQALQQWTFINSSIPMRMRVYFFTSHMVEVGYVECLLVAGGPCNVGKYSLGLNFAGQNPSLREIWFYDKTPTRLAGDTDKEPYYVIKAFTLGYIQDPELCPSPPEVDRLSVIPYRIPLLIGNEIDITAPIRRGGDLGKISENDFAVGEVYSNATDVDLAGAVHGNFSAYTPTLPLPVFGFGGMVNNGELVGQGHFFYVSPHITTDSSLCQDNRCFDYGLDSATYSLQIPEFGFNEHLMQFIPSPVVELADLSLEQGVIFSVIVMAKMISGTGPYDLVTGLDVNSLDIPLSWARVEAVDESQHVDRLVPTLDGRYNGAGSLFLPAGNYTITFSSPFYQSWTYPETYVIQWSQGPLRLIPYPLCPEGQTCESSPLSASATQLNTGFPSALCTKPENTPQENNFGLSMQASYSRAKDLSVIPTVLLAKSR
jgi:hypothetical protein